MKILNNQYEKDMKYLKIYCSNCGSDFACRLDECEKQIESWSYKVKCPCCGVFEKKLALKDYEITKEEYDNIDKIN